MAEYLMIPEALKAQQWERAKGELRALVALQGSYSYTANTADKLEKVEARVEEFIADFEALGLHE